MKCGRSVALAAVLLISIVQTPSAGYAAVPVPTRVAQPVVWTGFLSSFDLGASVFWSYNPATGVMSGTVTDRDDSDGICAIAYARGFAPKLGDDPMRWYKETCSGSVPFKFTEADYRHSMTVTVCVNKNSSCRSTQPDVGCSIGYPVRLPLEAETPEEVKYLSTIELCTDRAWSASSIVNRSDVIWSISRLDGTSPPVTYVSEPSSNALFRAVRPDRGTRPLMLPGATVLVTAAPTDIRWSLDPYLSFSWVMVDPIADAVVSFGADQAIDLVSRSSKRWGAFSACAYAVYDIGKTYRAVDLDDIAGVALDSAGALQSGVTCVRKMGEATSDALKRWSRTVGLDDIERVLGAAKYGTRFTALVEGLETLAHTLPVV